MGELDESSEIEKEIKICLELYKDVIDNENWVINYPYGSYSEKVINIAKTCGCKAEFSVKVEKVDRQKDNPYILPRLDANDFPPKSLNYLEY